MRLPCLLNSQNNYSLGYKAGFPIGYCYNQGIGCIAPITPIVPIPIIGESYDSSMDGYNRGLLDGIKSYNSYKSSLNYKKTTNNLNPYSTPQNIPEFKPFAPDLDFYQKVMSQKQEDYNSKQSQTNLPSSGDPEFDQFAKELISTESINLRKQYIKLCKAQYNTFTNFPTSFKNGVYTATFINGDELIEQDCQVIIQDNRIIATAIKNASHPYVWDHYKEFFPSIEYKDLDVFISDNYPIEKGKTKYSWKFTNGYKIGPTWADATTEEVYFNEYLTEYNTAQNLLSEIKKKYKTKKIFEKISDGWHTCYLTNNIDFCDIRNVYVENGKIIKWIGSISNEIIVDLGGVITNCKTSFSKTWPAEQTKPFFSNTFLSQPKTEIYDAYFIDL
jgi:hypothetical protein